MIWWNCPIRSIRLVQPLVALCFWKSPGTWHRFIRCRRPWWFWPCGLRSRWPCFYSKRCCFSPVRPTCHNKGYPNFLIPIQLTFTLFWNLVRTLQTGPLWQSCLFWLWPCYRPSWIKADQLVFNPLAEYWCTHLQALLKGLNHLWLPQIQYQIKFINYLRCQW